MAEVYIEDDFVEVQRYGGFSLKELSENKELFLFRMAPGLINPSDLINKEVKIGKQRRIINVNGKEVQLSSGNRNQLNNSSLLVPDSKIRKLQPIDRSIEYQVSLTKSMSIEASDSIDLVQFETVKHHPPILMERDFFRVTELPDTWKKLKRNLQKRRLKTLEKVGIKQNSISHIPNTPLPIISANERDSLKKKKKNRVKNVFEVSVKEELSLHSKSPNLSFKKKMALETKKIQDENNLSLEDASKNKLVESFNEAKNNLWEIKNNKQIKDEKLKSLKEVNKLVKEEKKKSIEEIESFKEIKKKPFKELKNKSFEEQNNSFKRSKNKSLKEKKRKRKSSESSSEEEDMEDMTFKEEPLFNSQEAKTNIKQEPDSLTLKRPKKKKRCS